MAQVREIPVGKILLSEYGETAPTDWSEEVALAQAYSPLVRSEVLLYRASPGWTRAGSVALWRNGCVGVHWIDHSGAGQGRRYRDDADGERAARAQYDRLVPSEQLSD